MNKIYLDFETYYSSKDFSLSKMSTQDYITDPRFETIGVAIAVDDADPVWYTGTDIATALHNIDWTTSIMVAHNAQFDGAILHYIYGIQPAYLLCTWSLARVTGAFIIEGGSLAKLAMVAQQAGLAIPHKGTEVILADGKRTNDFTLQELAAYGVYCKTDVVICRALYKELRPQTTAQELEFQDNIIKAFTRPLLTLDVPLLEQERDSERLRKEQLFVEVQELLGIPNIKEVSKALASPLSFAKVLTKLGVEPPTKLSKTTGKRTNSFAKTDAGMLALLEHENPLVALVTAVKLGTNGSISETRAVRMLEVSGRGPIPMSYIIHGAHTSRLSGGGEKLNVQNLPAGRNGQTSALRRAILAPKGKQIVVVDSANLESRVLAYVANSVPKLSDFREGKDPYVSMACSMYNLEYDELHARYKAGEQEAVQQRQIAKSAELGLGFQAGAERFTSYCKERKIVMDIDTATSLVHKWRNASANQPIVKLWKDLQWVLGQLHLGGTGSFGGPSGDLLHYGSRVVIGHTIPGIRLPDGVWINYYQLNATKGEFGIQYQYSKRDNNLSSKYIYGGAAVENVVQAIGSCVIKYQLNLIAQHYPVVMQTHDEVAFLVPDDPLHIQHGLDIAKWAFSSTPHWAEGLPLKGEVDHAYRYGDCK